MNEIYYTALYVIHPQELIAKFPPKHKNAYAHHSTIAFKPESLEGIEPGKAWKIKVLGRAFDEKGDALLVENSKSRNKYPHITLSCAEGIGASYSNELLEKAVENNTIEYFAELYYVDAIEGYETEDGKAILK